MKNFYVYYSYEEWGRGYIGKRECYCLPKEDIKYFGSFKDKTFRPTQKIILDIFETKEEALRAEVSLHDFYQVDINPHFANKAKQTAVGFSYDRTGEKNSQKWFDRMTGDNHPGKREEVREKQRQAQLKLGENHSSRRPEGRERAREVFTGDRNPNRSPEGRERCSQTMSTPERKILSRKVGRKTLQALREKNPNHQSEAGKKAHKNKDELGRSLLSMRNYPKGIGLRDDDGNLVYGPPDLNNMKYIDPDHPELGVRSPGTLVRMQKSRGYLHGKENRVKLTNDESRSS
jgi:hypothetical protein